MNRTLARLLPTLALCGALGACVVIGTDSHSKYHGRHVSDRTLAQVEPGATQEYVVALLGEPSTRTDLSDGSSVLKWSYTRKTTQRNSLILVFNGHTSSEEHGAVYVELGQDGLVRRTWRD